MRTNHFEMVLRSTSKRWVLAPILITTLVIKGQNVQLKSGVHPEDMDETCKPCTDFWRYVNGGWIDKNPIPANRQAWGGFPLLEEANLERVRTIIDDSVRAQGTVNLRRMGDFYTSCMDTAAIDKLGVNPLKPDFKRIENIHSKSDLITMLIEFQQTPALVESSGNPRVVGLFRLRSVPDFKNPKRVVAGIVERDSPGRTPSSIFSLPDRGYYLNGDARSKEIRDAFVEHVTRILELAGSSKEESVGQAKSVLEFETAYAHSVMTIAERRDPEKVYHPMDLEGLNSLAPEFDWARLLRAVGLPSSTSFLVTEPEMIRKFNTQITSVPLDEWKSWLRWRVLDLGAPYLAKPFEEEDFRFNRGVLAGVRDPNPRSETCARTVDSELTDALGNAYVAKYFPPDAKQRMLRLVENMRAALKQEIEQASWMTGTTRAQALEKLASMQVQVGYPDRWKDYSSVKIDPGQFLENSRAASRFLQKYELAKIGKPADRIDWAMSVTAVNAYSNPFESKIVFPAGFLQPPYFDNGADDAVNYAAVGAVIGHEMGHQFDDSGSKFDATGTLRNWWTEDDRKRFDERASCVAHQFDTIDVGEGLHHNGRQVLGEALGDLGGMETAYRAWKNSLGGKPAPLLDGYTGDQRFFIAYARMLGIQYRPEAMRLQLSTNNHPLAKWRANATLMNMPEFQAAFHCTAGDPMSPPAEQQCHVW